MCFFTIPEPIKEITERFSNTLVHSSLLKYTIHGILYVLSLCNIASDHIRRFYYVNIENKTTDMRVVNILKDEHILSKMTYDDYENNISREFYSFNNNFNSWGNLTDKEICDFFKINSNKHSDVISAAMYIECSPSECESECENENKNKDESGTDSSEKSSIHSGAEDESVNESVDHYRQVHTIEILQYLQPFLYVGSVINFDDHFTKYLLDEYHKNNNNLSNCKNPSAKNCSISYEFITLNSEMTTMNSNNWLLQCNHDGLVFVENEVE